MRRLLIGIMAGLMLSVPIVRAGADPGQYSTKAAMKSFKAMQKAQLKALELQQKRQKQSWEGMRMTKAQRQQMEHQLEREKRQFCEKLRNDLEAWKDRQQMVKESIQ